ncbi:MAG: SDR family oxidoreductase [Bacteroidales bacterium]|nr:SDR family oxidoreductase [Bacteroidales bacterium]
MTDRNGQVIWITGGSSGIGEACAYRYAAEHASLVLTALTAEELEPVVAKCRDLGATVYALPYDLQHPDGIEALAEEAWNAFHRIDILYCNAGISQRTTVEDTSMGMIRKLMEINYFAPVAIAKAVLPKMLAAGGGHIAVTTSIAGKFGFPLRCGYCSSKHALYGFFETLQAEYSDRNIHVTIVCPGRVRTNISLHALDKDGKPHGKMDPGQGGGLSPEQAAKIIQKAIDRSKREVLVGRKELIMVYVKRFFPGLCAKIAKRIKSM